MMVLRYYDRGNLRNYLNITGSEGYKTKIRNLREIARGLLSIHNSGKFIKIFIQAIYWLMIIIYLLVI